MSVPTTVQLSEDLYEKLRKESYDTRQSQSEIIRQALILYFEKNKKSDE